MGGFLAASLSVTIAYAATHALQTEADETFLSDEEIGLHVIAAADDGRPVRPHMRSGKGFAERQAMSESEMKEYLTAMIRNIDRQPMVNGKRQILVFIHGGMNRRDGAIERAARIGANEELKKEFYPIFINWNSEPFSCYGEHLLYVRQGEREPYSAPLSAPLYLLCDVARGVSRAPFVWSRLAINAMRQPGGLWKGNPEHERIVFAQQAQLYRRDRKESAPFVTATTITGSDFRGHETIVEGTAHVLCSPGKALGALVLDTIGTGSWDMMLRRANELFDSPVRWDDVWAEDKKGAKQAGSQKGIADHTRIKEIAKIADSENPNAKLTEEQKKVIRDHLDALLPADPKAQKRKVDYYARSRPGAVEQFLSRLDEERRNGKRYSITLVGHSMGTIVGNEMLKRHPDLPFDKIIYMAAACSVKDCQDSVVPYLRLRKRENNPATFYNLSLHPIAEAAEASFSPDSQTPILPGVGKTVVGLVLVPRGSLLEWLDAFFTNPVNYEDRRLGKWGTAITSAGIFPSDVAGCVHLKMFPVGIKSKDVPQKHGQFADDKGEVHFWRDEFKNEKTSYP